MTERRAILNKTLSELLTEGQQLTQIVGADGSVIDTEVDYLGKYHLAVTANQDVNESAGNTSEVNLAAGATFTGTPVSTLGVVGLQWNLNTDQNCTIYSEESAGSHTGLGTVQTLGTTTLLGTDTVWERAFEVGDTITVEGETDRIIAAIVSNTQLTVTVAFTTTASGLTFTHYHWDISYPFEFIAKSGLGEGETVQATMAYWRLRVVNNGSIATTYFRVSGVLCPIATPLPSSLSEDRRLQVESTLSGRENTGRHVWVSPTSTLNVNPTVRLVGTNFDGTVKDTNFWTETVTGTGSITQTGKIVLSTGPSDSSSVTADSTTKYESVRRARFVVGSALKFIGAFTFVTEGTVDNIRRCGAYDANEGFFFELDGTTFSVGSRKATVDTLISSGSFNGNLGLTFTPTADTNYKLEIEWTPLGAFYYVNGKLLHQSLGGQLTNYLTLPITFENNNDNGLDEDVDMDCLGVVIVREGELATAPTNKYIAGADTVILKYGAGDLHNIVINDNSGSFIIYDGLSAAGTIIAAVDCSKGFGTLSYNCPFSDGLYIATTGAGVKITIIYE